jgi:hypothetical protein
MQDNDPKKKRKAGLHKEISSIFEGVPVPGRREQPSGAAVPERAEQGPVRPLAPEPQVPQSIPAIKPGPAKQPVPKAAAVKTAGKSVWRDTWLKIKNKLFKSESGDSSSRQKVMIILMPILFIALIYVLMPLFRRPKMFIPRGGEAAEVAAHKGEIDWRIPAPYPKTLRDPMQLSSETAGGGGTEVAENAGSLVVKGIVHSNDHPAAVVGTQIVHEGDVVSGASVIKINQDSVEFKLKDKNWVQKVQR